MAPKPHIDYPSFCSSMWFNLDGRFDNSPPNVTIEFLMVGPGTTVNWEALNLPHLEELYTHLIARPPAPTDFIQIDRSTQTHPSEYDSSPTNEQLPIMFADTHTQAEETSVFSVNEFYVGELDSEAQPITFSEDFHFHAEHNDINTEEIINTRVMNEGNVADFKKLKSQRECPFCKCSRAPKHIYKSHPLRNSNGFIVCPVLQGLVCSNCGATGQTAHVLDHCPLKSYNTKD